MDKKTTGMENSAGKPENGLNGTQRREKILTMMRDASNPLSGGALGKATGVSRQVVVQDIALLRTEGHPIVATARGYILNAVNQKVRLFKVCHTNEDTEDELKTIIDLGGCVMDVMINHRVYGKMTAVLNIKNRRDIQKFLDDIRAGKSSPLMNVTSGYHFHHISAEQDEILDEIGEALRDKNYITELMPYEEL